MHDQSACCSRLAVAEREELQEQLAQARGVIAQLASQVDHHLDVQSQLTGLSICLCTVRHYMAAE